MNNHELDKEYMEWCSIMNQCPNMRDEIIFTSGRNFHLLNIREKNNNDNK